MARTAVGIDALRLRIPSKYNTALFDSSQDWDAAQQLNPCRVMYARSGRERVEKGVQTLWSSFLNQRLSRLVLNHIRSVSAKTTTEFSKIHIRGLSLKQPIKLFQHKSSTRLISKVPILPPILSNRGDFPSPLSPSLVASPRLRPLRSCRHLQSMW